MVYPKAVTSTALINDTLKKNTSPVQTVIEHWANSLFQNSTGLKTNLARFGLQNAQDVVTFLRTPAGEAAIKKMSVQIEQDRENQDRIRSHYIQHEILVHRIKIAILLWRLEHKAHAAEQIRELAEELNTKAIQQAKGPSASADTPEVAKMEKVLAEYDRTLNIARNEHNNIEKILKALSQQHSQLIAHSQVIVDKYLAYESGMSEIERLFTSHSSTLNQAMLEDYIQAYTEAMHDRSKEFMMLVDEEKDVTELKAHIETINLKIGAIYDRIDVINGEKYYAKAIPLDSYHLTDDIRPVGFENADYILKINQRIVEDNGVFYLLEAGEDLNSEESKATARNRYENKKRDLMAVKVLVLTNKGEETKQHQQRINDTEQKITNNNEEKLLINNQILVIEAAQADAMQTYKQMQNPTSNQNIAGSNAGPTAPPAPSLTPRPSLSPMPSSTKPKANATKTVPKPPSLNLDFKQRAALLLNQPQQLRMNEFMDIINLVPPHNIGPNVSKTLQSLAQRGATFPQQMMESILRNLAGLGGTPPTVASINQQMKYEARQPQPKASWAPNPFKTNPFK